MITEGKWEVEGNNAINHSLSVKTGKTILFHVWLPAPYDNTSTNLDYNLLNQEAMANARLIASAPELLAACKAMITDFDLGEPSIKESLLKMKQVIAEAEAK